MIECEATEIDGPRSRRVGICKEQPTKQCDRCGACLCASHAVTDDCLSTGEPGGPKEKHAPLLGLEVAAVQGHVHRCMRCGEEFACRNHGACTAGYDVVPKIVVAGPFGPMLVDHCPADTPERHSLEAYDPVR